MTILNENGSAKSVDIYWHECINPKCYKPVEFDDEPCCHEHSPDSGSTLPGFSAREMGCVALSGGDATAQKLEVDYAARDLAPNGEEWVDINGHPVDKEFLATKIRIKELLEQTSSWMNRAQNAEERLRKVERERDDYKRNFHEVKLKLENLK